MHWWNRKWMCCDCCMTQHWLLHTGFSIRGLNINTALRFSPVKEKVLLSISCVIMINNEYIILFHRAEEVTLWIFAFQNKYYFRMTKLKINQILEALHQFTNVSCKSLNEAMLLTSYHWESELLISRTHRGSDLDPMSLSRRLSQDTVSSTLVTHWAAMSGRKHRQITMWTQHVT